MEHDVAAYTVMAIRDSRVINKQLHIRPPLNMVSQHDLIYIYEDKVFRQLCIGNRLIRSPVTEAELDSQISGKQPHASNGSPLCRYPHGLHWAEKYCQAEQKPLAHVAGRMTA